MRYKVANYEHNIFFSHRINSTQHPSDAEIYKRVEHVGHNRGPLISTALKETGFDLDR